MGGIDDIIDDTIREMTEESKEGVIELPAPQKGVGTLEYFSLYFGDWLKERTSRRGFLKRGGEPERYVRTAYEVYQAIYDVIHVKHRQEKEKELQPITPDTRFRRMGFREIDYFGLGLYILAKTGCFPFTFIRLPPTHYILSVIPNNVKDLIERTYIGTRQEEEKV